MVPAEAPTTMSSGLSQGETCSYDLLKVPVSRTNLAPEEQAKVVLSARTPCQVRQTGVKAVTVIDLDLKVKCHMRSE
jgi:hypothetical protein